MTEQSIVDATSAALAEPAALDQALAASVAPATARRVPATASQEGLWLLHQSMEEPYLYNCPLAFRLLGRLDRRALAGAFDELARRHESLRTVFASEGGQLMQVVKAESSVAIRMVDLTSLGSEAARAELNRLSEASSLEVFDLEQGPLLRVTLAQIAPEDHALFVTVHHTVYDEWSTDILSEELGLLYDIFKRNGSPAELSPPRMQYADFAIRQRDAEQSKVRQRHLGYWKRKLAAAARPVTPPLDHREHAKSHFRAAHERFTLEAPVCAALEALAQKEHSPPVSILIAALAVVLNRYTRESDVSVGYLVSGRVLTETERIIGPFINSLVMRVQLEGDPTFTELVRKVRDLTFEAYSNQDVPFQHVVRELNPARDAFGHPLFRTCVNYHPTARRELKLAGLQTQALPYVDIAPFDFVLDAHPSLDGCLECHFEYRSALFDASTVRRFAQHFRALLETCLKFPAQPVSRASMLSADDRFALLHGYNATAREYDLTRPLTEILATHARATPDKEAIVVAGQSLSYAQLDSFTDGVAAFLQQRGVGPETIIALFAETSVELIIGMFGILKSGAAYVAVDPQDPASRVSYMLQDARVALVLTQERLIERLPPNGPPHACLDRDAALFAAAGTPINTHHDPLQLAYLMYTSGSTGKPKAVAVPWSSVMNHVHSFCEVSALRSSDRCMLFSSVTFDGSVEEIFAPLLCGATLVLHPERPIPFETLETLVVQHGLTFLDFTAGYWNVWLETLLARKRHIPEPVRQVVIGGELIRANQLLAWEQVNRGGQVDLLITYGPTEATVIATAIAYRSARNPLGPEPLDGYIGRELGNTAIYVLDDALEPVPLGAIGDIYIAGENVSRGYLGAPALTAERFIPNPHAQVPGQRMYWTGDLGLRREDGILRYLGRADNQVKFRGFRIELAEIDRVIALSPDAQAGVTLLASAPNGDPTLVSFVMPTSGSELNAAAMAQFLAARLPAYMVPQRIEIVRTFPVKLNGKTDLAKLAESMRWGSESTTAGVSSETTIARGRTHDGLTEQLVELFTTLLNRGALQPEDNFFRTGGHSLLALQVLSKIRQQHGLQIAMKDFYLHPTAQGLAELIARHKQGAPLAAAPKLAPIARIERNPVSGTAS